MALSSRQMQQEVRSDNELEMLLEIFQMDKKSGSEALVPLVEFSPRSEERSIKQNESKIDSRKSLEKMPNLPSIDTKQRTKSQKNPARDFPSPKLSAALVRAGQADKVKQTSLLKDFLDHSDFV